MGLPAQILHEPRPQQASGYWLAISTVCSSELLGVNLFSSPNPKVSGVTLTYPLEEGRGARVGGGPGSSVVVVAASKVVVVHLGYAALDVHHAHLSG